MKKQKKNSIYIMAIVIVILVLMQVTTIFVVKPYVIKNFGLNSKDSLFIVILCYLSALYGMVSITFITFIEKKLRK